MTANERWLITGAFVVFVAIAAWLLGTVSINSGRISVLERRADNHQREMGEMRDEIKDHRRVTEFDTPLSRRTP